MRVGFDLSPLRVASETGAPPESAWPSAPGVPRLARELVSALERRSRLEVVRLEPGPNTNLRWWRSALLPRAVRGQNLLGIHSFTSAFAFRGPGRRVQTIHELPWLHGIRENADVRHRAWARFGPLVADRIVTATEFVARDLRSGYRFGKEKIVVCPWGVSDRFAHEPPPGTSDDFLREHYSLPDVPLVLCPGAVRAKKNLAGVLRAVQKIEQRGEHRLHIVVSGKETDDLKRDLRLAASLGVSARISVLNRIEEDHLPGMLRLAAAVPVLAGSEGFGLLTLEALACGTPVVVPRDSAQAEVAGAVGITVDTGDDDSVADGLLRAVHDKGRSRGLLAARAAELSWDRCAERIEAVWQELSG